MKKLPHAGAAFIYFIPETASSSKVFIFVILPASRINSGILTSSLRYPYERIFAMT
jgi:hypothetical protein